MSKIALIDATPGVLTSVEAVAGGWDVVVCDRGGVPDDAALLICESPRGAEPPSRTVPTLLLLDKGVGLGRWAGPSGPVTVLRKPVDLIELRAAIGDLLSGAAASRPLSEISPMPAPADWLTSPRVPGAAQGALRGALGVVGSVWLVGEPGTGRRRVAAALALAHSPALSLRSWPVGVALDESVSGLVPGASALFVADVETRPLADQQALEDLLSMRPDVRVVATGCDDPGAAVAAGTLTRGLYHLLSRVAVRLGPLRERRGDIAALALDFADTIAAARVPGLRVELSDAAVEKLQLYPWAFNITELEGVIARSVVQALSAEPMPGSTGAGGREVLRIDADDLIFAAPLSASLTPPPTEVATARRSDRRSAVVVALPLAPLAPAATAPAAPTGTGGDRSIEFVLAGLAHDLRNPLTTLKTFADLASMAEAAENSGETDAGSSSLAAEAVAACSRIDAPLELLRQYGGLAEAQPTRLDLVSLLAEAIEESALPVAAAVKTRQPRAADLDPYHARFIAAAILDESRQRLGEGEEAWVDVADSDSAIEITVPRGGRAVEGLDRLVGDTELPWRLALAREVARRSGGDLQLDIEADEWRVRWSTPVVEETKDGQADRSDRRRRSRSS